MARERRAEYDSPEFERRYLAGETLASIAAWLGVHPTAIYKAARLRGMPRRKWHIGPNSKVNA